MSGDFDAVLVKLGLDFGRYQRFLFVLFLLPTIFIHSCRNFNFLFLLYEPKHKCTLPDELATQNVTATECYLVHNATYKTGCIDGYTYERDIVEATLVSRYDLFCDRIYQKDLFLSIAMGCAAIGLPLCAYVSDRWGRRWGFLLQHMSFVVGSLLSIPMPTFPSWCAARLLEAITSMSTYNICFVYALELVSPAHRTTVSISFALFFVFGMVTLGGLAYAFPHWLGLSLITSVPFVPFVVLFWICPESPRWLYSEGRFDEAKKVLERMYNWEGRELKENELDNLLSVDKKPTEKPLKPSFFLILKGRRLRAKFLCCCFIWISVALTYTSIAFNADNFGINFYAAFVLQSAVEAPAIIVCLFVLERFGRVWPLSIASVLGGIACLMGTLNAVIPEYFLMVFGLVGKFFCCVAYCCVYQLANELYPTVIRSFALGSTGLVGMSSNVLMPYIVKSAKTMKSLPLVIMGILGILAGIVALALPETKGQHMPESLEDAEIYGSVGWEAVKENYGRLSGAKDEAEKAKMLGNGSSADLSV